MSIEWDELVAVAKASGATDEIAEAMALLITKAYEIAAEEEREACARVCDEQKETYGGPWGGFRRLTVRVNAPTRSVREVRSEPHDHQDQSAEGVVF